LHGDVRTNSRRPRLGCLAESLGGLAESFGGLAERFSEHVLRDYEAAESASEHVLRDYELAEKLRRVVAGRAATRMVMNL